eukprot:gnl/TRDRNA2_/TRDRNA2_50750_c0_seq1.p1 gnl/TRDRNA2_/TRDRNA2_50750_c0~~gnl/TRDRNA2_/TRDRNA2_50750_c0_seq1.p1  ORF type:complete len:130 (-),score=12.34 gnl/TRDRNA2_/TRDRNA2_50750_c0_seq1:12-401(-)
MRLYHAVLKRFARAAIFSASDASPALVAGAAAKRFARSFFFASCELVPKRAALCFILSSTSPLAVAAAAAFDAATAAPSGMPKRFARSLFFASSSGASEGKTCHRFRLAFVSADHSIRVFFTCRFCDIC